LSSTGGEKRKFADPRKEGRRKKKKAQTPERRKKKRVVVLPQRAGEKHLFVAGKEGKREKTLT